MIPIEAELREKLLLVMRVETGALRASDAARQMGVSRKTLYEWIRRGLEGMAAALAPRLAGRPAKPTDPQMETVLSEHARLRRENEELRQTLRVRELLHEPVLSDVRPTEKKTGKGRRGDRRGRADALRPGRDVSATQ
jgi:transposase